MLAEFQEDPKCETYSTEAPLTEIDTDKRAAAMGAMCCGRCKRGPRGPNGDPPTGASLAGWGSLVTWNAKMEPEVSSGAILCPKCCKRAVS